MKLNPSSAFSVIGKILTLIILFLLSQELKATPVCNAQFVHYTGNNPDSVHFYPTGTTATTYSWNFGDGFSATTFNPWHMYAPGNYYACLTITITDSSGTCTDTWCDSVYVSAPPPPVCNAQFGFYAGQNPDSLHFYPTGNAALTYYWDFGDGSTSTDQHPWHYFMNDGTYYVCLTVYDSTSAGTCTDTWCDSVHVGTIPPVCNAHFAFYAINNPDSIHFYPTGTVATSYYWDFGDGSTSTSQYPWHFYVNAGSYYACLTVYDSTSAGTCTDTWCDSVYVGVVPPPVCDAHFAHYFMNNPDSIHFYPTGPTATSYYWDFGDGSTSTSQVPWHLYAPGNYYACLTVTDSTSGGTCTNTWCDSIHVGVPPPPCNAQYTFYTIANPDSVHFIGPVNPPGTQYYWSFGDGTSSTSQYPWHFFTSAGSYYVCLYVTDSSSAGTCSNYWCDSIYISTPPPPICNAQFAHYSINNPDSVHFYPTGGAMTTYYWDFGDGTTSTSQYPWHLYATAGSYYACLTVTDSSSSGTCTDTWCDSIIISSPPPPTCDAHFGHYSINNPDSVHFYATGSLMTTYSWDFGDGNTSSSQYPWHYYSTPGHYYVCLTVTDSTSAGTCTDTWCDSIIIGTPPPPQCDAHFAHYSINNADSVHFYPTGTSALTYYWDFGDGTTSSSQYPWHFYSTPGTYYACLTITDSTSAGTCSDTWCDSVVTITPQVHAHFSHYTISNPDSVHFISIGNPNGTNYYWDFGDGGTSTSAYPWHLFASSGIYFVCLHVDLSANSDDWCDSVRVGSITGIGENQINSPVVNIYPNPVNDRAVVLFDQVSGPLTFRIIDLTGRIIFEKRNLKNGTADFNAEGILNGSYIYEVSVEGRRVSTGMLIVLH